MPPRALQHLAACIARHVRRRGDLAARYGGEEFVVVLPDTDEPGAMQVAEAIRAEAEGSRLRDGSRDLPPVTVSIGCTTVRRSNRSSLEALTKAADDALYRAKASGRNGIVWKAVEPVPLP